MARPAYRGRNTCESCKSIDVRHWHREGRLRAGQYFSWAWTYGGAPSGNIAVRTEQDSIVLIYRFKSGDESEWTSVEQRVPIIWTACRLGGQRPWFVCSGSSRGHTCGRRAALLYGAGELFACRHCYGLAYASQQESPCRRGIDQAQKIRMKLGGSASLCDPFPDKPKRMHWRTYLRLRARAMQAQNRSMVLTMDWINRLKRGRKLGT